ncbi:MAG: alpha/beta hydrolase [Actinomycetota bacterium]|nr:alpha/beta hydrolase [Actinomycetota bacterium]
MSRATFRRLGVLAFSLVLAVSALAPPAFATGGGGRPSARTAPLARVRTFTYCVLGGVRLQMTIFEPLDGTRPAPAVLQVHGGAWERGHRVRSLRQADGVDVGSLGTRDLVAQGVVVASVAYELAPASPWPSQMQDVACAMRSLRAHAAQLGIDPSRIAVLGSSAGGQLASLLATDPNAPAWSVGPYAQVSAQPTALVDEFGPVELISGGFGRFMRHVLARVFGSVSPSSATLRAASPLQLVRPGDPPTLILQGSADPVVPASQSLAFAAALRRAGVPVQLVVVRGGGHGLRTPGESPPPPVLAAMVTRFLLSKLG